MNRRFHAAVVIARRQAFETLLAPGLYVTLALGLLLGFFLVTGFAASVDTAGFNPTLHPLYDTLGRFLTGSFGLAFVQKLFAEGPFLLALVARASFLMVNNTLLKVDDLARNSTTMALSAATAYLMKASPCEAGIGPAPSTRITQAWSTSLAFCWAADERQQFHMIRAKRFTSL